MKPNLTERVSVARASKELQGHAQGIKSQLGFWLGGGVSSVLKLERNPWYDYMPLKPNYGTGGPIFLAGGTTT